MAYSTKGDPYRLIGTTLAGKYRLEKYAGGGAMGAVYRSMDITTNNRVAVKILKPDVVERNPEFAALFNQEVLAARNLVHPHIVKVVDSGTEDDLSFMVMEWLEGQSLEHFLQQEQLSLDTTTNLFEQICSAVSYAHKNNTIHLDIKPANIFLLSEKRTEYFIKVIDFGMAKILSSESGTTVTRFMGTHHYCSPEQFGGKVSSRSDIYSLGITLYQMISGVLPFGMSYINAKMRQNVSLPPFPPIRSGRPSVPAGIDDVIKRALSRNPRDRQESVEQLFTEYSLALQTPSTSDLPEEDWGTRFEDGVQPDKPLDADFATDSASKRPDILVRSVVDLSERVDHVEEPRNPTMTTNHIWTYMARGGLYALTSTSALFAGYVMQKHGFDVFDIPYLAVPVIASVYFFMCYASRFHSLEFRDSSEKAKHAVLEPASIEFFPIVAALLFAISLLVRFLFTHSISLTLLIAFGLYVGMYVYYGRFLWHHPSSGDIPIVRHRLFWPVILSIGISLYYGLAFSMLSTSVIPLAPVGLILIVYVVSNLAKLRMRRFSVVTLLVFLTITILIVLANNGLIHLPASISGYFSLMFFCLTVSAYLAVFEAWKVTSDIARTWAAKSVIDSNPGVAMPMPKPTRYSVATLTTLMLSVWAMPLFFVFSGYGTVFLVGFVVHAFGAFVLWYLCGRGKKLVSLPWGAIKITAGISFLSLLVAATVFPAQPDFHVIKWLVSAEGMSILALPVFWSVYRFLLHLRREHRRNKQLFLQRVLLRRVNFIRLLTLLCWVACFILLTFIQRYQEASADYYRAELAFDAYAVCIFLCLIVEILDWFEITPLMALISKFLLGLLYLTRTVTSCLIGLCVFLPSIGRGVGVRASLVSTIPFVLAAIGGFALNDYFDASKDAINKPYRAIPSKRLTPGTVLFVSLVSLSFAVIGAVYASRDRTQIILYAVAIVGVGFYNLFVKYLSLSKTVLTSTVSSLPIFFSVITLNYPKVFLFLPVAAGLFVLGREWLMDIRDIRGDSKAGIVTMPMRLGPKQTARFGFAFQFLSVALLVPVAASANSTLGYLLLLSISLALIVFYPLWHYGSGKYQRRVIQGLWLPMLMGIMLLIA